MFSITGTINCAGWRKIGSMILVTIRYRGDEYSLDGDEGWLGDWYTMRRILAASTPEDSPSIPHWPQSVADAMVEEVGAEVLYVVPQPPYDPGTIY